MESVVHLAADRGVATVTLDSPRNRNALSQRLIEELSGHLEAATADEDVRAVLLTHTGPVFCAGADLGEAAAEGMDAGSRRLIELLTLIVELPKPVVAKVTGKARAGGLGLLGACDIVLADERGDYAFTEARLGLSPAMISLTLLPRLDPRAAGRYFITGETFGGPEAERIGLLTRAVPAAGLDAAVETVLAGLRAGSPQGLAESKRLVTEQVRRELAERGAEMAARSARLFSSDEAREGMSAFLQKRPPAWAVQ
ncbi:enoyl-CoA hydratase [Acrocarpospora corrugata]|uniref:Enoyl-CoA hydratase n=1 Tax=Acrocarpospora corrugata TaxID=35763 RepID=A0A5M3VQ76_9ACTN|nr:enoyl-CoA hydratase family protein [Acrocarpospora corrugata]GER98633.1 enoyl-CoA hydratase [Acrocarpospora corrugata]